MSGETAAYAHLAQVYSAGGWGRFSEEMTQTVLTMAQQLGMPQRAHVVDLACGIGIACIAFSKAGYRVTGIDLSPEMLAQARQKAADAGVEVQWLERDMRDWEVSGPADLVTCMYDALNYMLTPEDLGAVFASIARALEPGGLFIFDMNTLYGLAVGWGSKAMINFDGEDLFIASQTHWDYETSTNTLVFHGFTRGSNGAWERWTETHVERGFALAQIRALLATTGLEVLAMLDARANASVEVGPTTGRVLVVAQKPEGEPEGVG